MFDSVIPVKLVLDLIGERESRTHEEKAWIPASAGMTKKEIETVEDHLIFIVRG